MTGKSGLLQSMGFQRARHNLATEQVQQHSLYVFLEIFFYIFLVTSMFYSLISSYVLLWLLFWFVSNIFSINWSPSLLAAFFL